MKIGLIAPPWAAIPPTSYGGTESVVDGLARGLSVEGHDVVLFATGDSTAPVRIEHLLEQAAGDQIGDSRIELRHVASAYEALAGCDVIHDHTMAGPAWALSQGQRQVTTTCHGPLKGELRSIYGAYGHKLPLVAISHHQAASAPEVSVAKVIHHGLDPEHFPDGRGDGGYLMFLGSMAWEKGAHEAAAIAKATGHPLKIAAKMREPAERAYFAEHVEPLLGGNIEYIGEVGNGDKLALLAGARALLNPIRWAAPFGLVMLEALACGTPVLTYPNGAAPEIVDHGVTGWLAGDAYELVEAVEHLDELDRQACRAVVTERFSTTKMVADHLVLYEEMISS
jgi:glycosyltransferase involved in cell wall biosynthesis